MNTNTNTQPEPMTINHASTPATANYLQNG